MFNLPLIPHNRPCPLISPILLLPVLLLLRRSLNRSQIIFELLGNLFRIGFLALPLFFGFLRRVIAHLADFKGRGLTDFVAVALVRTIAAWIFDAATLVARIGVGVGFTLGVFLAACAEDVRAVYCCALGFAGLLLAVCYLLEV